MRSLTQFFCGNLYQTVREGHEHVGEHAYVYIYIILCVCQSHTSIQVHDISNVPAYDYNRLLHDRSYCHHMRPIRLVRICLRRELMVEVKATSAIYTVPGRDGAAVFSSNLQDGC
jgi:hypothetical protein